MQATSDTEHRTPGRHRAPSRAQAHRVRDTMSTTLLPLVSGAVAAGLLVTLAAGAAAGTGDTPAQPAASVPSADLTQAVTLSAASSAKLVADAKSAQAAEVARAARAAEAARVATITAANRAARAEAATRGPVAKRTPASAPERRTGRSAAVSGPAGAKALARDMVAARGWGAGEFRCLERLWEKESNWRHTARNASSGAYGIPQSLPAHKMASAGSDWRTNPATQITWGLNYISDRYSRPCNAWAHSQRVNWY